MRAPAAPPARSRRAAYLLLPALVPTVLVLGAGLGSAALQSAGLMPAYGPPRAGADAYRALVATPAVRDALVVSLWIAAASTAVAVAAGLAIALLVRASGPGARLLRAATLASVPVPHLVGAASFGLLLSDSGLVARVLGVEPGHFPALVAGPWWVAVVAEYAWKESAFVALVVLAALAAHQRDLDEAAAVLGAAPWQRLRRVVLPLAAPAVLAAGGIAFAYVLGSYEVAWLLGRTYPEPLPVLAFRLFGDADPARREQALAVALLTTCCAVAALGGAAALLRRTAMVRAGARR